MQAIQNAGAGGIRPPISHRRSAAGRAELLRLPVLRYQSDDVLRFSARIEKPYLFNYAKIDPTLSPRQVNLLQTCEREWRELVQGIEPDDVETLLKRIRLKKDYTIIEVDSMPKAIGMAVDMGFFGPNILIKILRPEKYDSRMEAAQVLRHELIHALHMETGEYRTNFLKSFFRILTFRPNWFPQFTALYDEITTSSSVPVTEKQIKNRIHGLSASEIREFKWMLLMEHVAYGLNAMRLPDTWPERTFMGSQRIGKFFQGVRNWALHSTWSEQECSQRSERFKEAIHVINRLVNAKGR